MAANSRFAVALHIAALLAVHGESALTSQRIAKSVNTNPVVVRRILCLLCAAGLVDCCKGKRGGARLARSPKTITLLDVYSAVESEGIFAQNSKPQNQACAVSCHMKTALAKVFLDGESALKQSLQSTTLATLVAPIS